MIQIEWILATTGLMLIVYDAKANTVKAGSSRLEYLCTTYVVFSFQNAAEWWFYQGYHPLFRLMYVMYQTYITVVNKNYCPKSYSAAVRTKLETCQ